MVNIKFLAIVFGLLLFATISNGQQIVSGYYIQTNNDTSFISIKLPMEPFGKLNAINLQKKLKVFDSLGQIKKIKPPDIKEFSFTFKDFNYHFFAKQFNGNSWHFFEALSTGPSLKLFYYFYKTKQGLHEYFIIENKPGAELQLTNLMRPKKIKSLLKDYFAGDTAVMEKIDGLPFRHRKMKKSLVSIVYDINSNGPNR